MFGVPQAHRRRLIFDMFALRPFVIGFLVFLLTAKVVAQTSISGQQIVQWSTLAEGSGSTLGDQGLRVVQTEGDWQRVWPKLAPRMGRPPQIDWLKNQIVLVHLPKGSNAGSVYVETMRYSGPAMVTVIAVAKTASGAGRDSRTNSGAWVACSVKRHSANYELSWRNVTVGGSNKCGCKQPCIRCRCGCACNPFPFALAYETYTTGQQSPSIQAEVRYLRNFGEFTRYWRSVNGPQSEIPRDIDFDRETLVAIHLGARVSGGYSLGIYSVRMMNEFDVEIQYYENQPRPGQITSQELTSPYVILAIPKTGGQIQVRKLPGKPYGS